MTAPDKIYIPSLLAADVVSYKTDCGIEYIRKDALLEWAKENLFGVCLDRLIEKIESM